MNMCSSLIQEVSEATAQSRARGLAALSPEHWPSVSVIVPCRNEEKFIASCINSLLANDYPSDRLEVIVVDGMSEDGTRAVIDSIVQGNSAVRLLDNAKRITPAAINLG